MSGLNSSIPDHSSELLSRTIHHNSIDHQHQLPSLETQASSPILYLPPLLSSLPESCPIHRHIKPLKRFPLATATRLLDIDPASLSLHRALHHFSPVDDQYAARPYEEAFNWNELELPEDEEREWYCVAFRSLRKKGSDGHALYEADKLAHEEAVRNGGLIMYWYGVPSPETGLNLATCVWQSRQHAILASSRSNHIRAAKLATAAYDIYKLERYVLRKRKGDVGIKVEPYLEGPVGW